MPFEIVRGNIAEFEADAIVNTANPRPEIGLGVDAAIHEKAGPKLLAARKKVGDIPAGSAAITPAYQLKAKYVIHAVGVPWEGGDRDEAALVRRCYDRALELAAGKKCRSVAFPLLSTGNYGMPRELALDTAVSAFRDFLEEHDMMITLVVLDRNSVAVSESLCRQVQNFIDEEQAQALLHHEYSPEENPRVTAGRERRTFGIPGGSILDLQSVSSAPPKGLPGRAAKDTGGEKKAAGRKRPAHGRRTAPQAPRRRRDLEAPHEDKEFLLQEAAAGVLPEDLDYLLKHLDAGFSETLLKLIDRSGKKDPEVYRKANVDRKLFSKIRNNPDYRPSKPTAVAFALALELNLEETQDLIRRAGYAFSGSSVFDVIVKFFIQTGNYDIFKLNEVLFRYDQPLVGGVSA